MGVIHVGFTEKYIRAFVDNTIRFILLIIAIVLTIGCVLAFVFSSVLTKPIQKLTDAANKVGEGNLDTHIDVKSNDEIGKLANSFNHMIENLKNSMTSIDNLNKEIEQHKAEQRLLQARKESQ